MASELTDPAHRREARVALAMLPTGGAMVVVSVIAAIAVLALIVAAPFGAVPHPAWSALWGAAAAVVACRNVLAGIAMMSAFDWRPLPGSLARSIAIGVAWPGWWLG